MIVLLKKLKSTHPILQPERTDKATRDHSTTAGSGDSTVYVYKVALLITRGRRTRGLGSTGEVYREENYFEAVPTSSQGILHPSDWVQLGIHLY